MTLPEIIIASLHCFCIRSVPVSNARIRRLFVHDIIRSLGDAILQGGQICDQHRVIDMNPDVTVTGVLYWIWSTAVYKNVQFRAGC